MNLSEEVVRQMRFIERYGDVFSIFSEGDLAHRCIDDLEQWVRSEILPQNALDKVISPEAKGFLLGGMLADRLKLPLAPITKQGRLRVEQNPLSNSCVDYSGKKKQLEITREHVRAGEHVLLVDDWFESCEQIRVCIDLIERCGAKVVGVCGLINDTSQSDIAPELFGENGYPFYCVAILER